MRRSIGDRLELMSPTSGAAESNFMSNRHIGIADRSHILNPGQLPSFLAEVPKRSGRRFQELPEPPPPHERARPELVEGEEGGAGVLYNPSTSLRRGDQGLSAKKSTNLSFRK